MVVVVLVWKLLKLWQKTVQILWCSTLVKEIRYFFLGLCLEKNSCKNFMMAHPVFAGVDI